jgi:hypothetical protein
MLPSSEAYPPWRAWKSCTLLNSVSWDSGHRIWLLRS